MTTTEAKAMTGFDVAWAAEAETRAARAGEPAWSIERRREAAALARSLTFPSRTDELWRRTDFRTLEAAIDTLSPFATTSNARAIDDLPRPIAERLVGGDAAVIVQRNASVAFEAPHRELERQGVIACSMERALREHPKLVESALGALLEPGYDWYTAIAAATRSGGVFVRVPDGVQAAVPIRIFQWLDGAGAIAMPRSIVSIGKDARATVVEEELSDGTDGMAFHNGGTEVFVGENAYLIHATLQDWSRNVYHYSNHRARVAREGELQWIQTMLGSRMAKANSYFDLAGPGARAYVNGFMFGDSRQHFHLHTLQRHQMDHTTSDLLIKTCLKQRARSIYQGLIQVSEGAQRTDAYQANRNLLLSDQARADSIPGLEILANDVRCTHGATIGHVDDEQMYYLQSRGLHPAEAQRLIVEGFFAPVLDRIPLESVRDELRQVIQRKIG